MGSLLVQEETVAAEVFATTDEVLGYSISKLCWEGPQEDLNNTLHTQPALLTHSAAVLKTFEKRYPDFKPAFTAGHSLGEFTALMHAGALTFPEALNLVCERARVMQDAAQDNPCGMTAVLGLSVDEVTRLCEQASTASGAGVWIANDNCPGQIVIAGVEEALAVAGDLFLENGAKKVVRLAVSIASHSPLMEQAAIAFDPVLQTTPIQDPKIPIISNVHAGLLPTQSEVRQDLREQLISRVRWTESVQYMLDAGVDTFIELGSKSVLTGLLRRIDRQATGLSLNTPQSFASLAELL